MKKQQGVTLIELIIAIAIIGVLAAVAIPAYQEQTKKARYTDGQAFLLELQTQMERHFFDNNTYPNGLSDMAGYASNNVLSEEEFYSVSMNIDGDCPIATCFELVAVPQGAQAAADNRNLELYSNGTRLPADVW